MTIDGENDYIRIEHAHHLAIGDNNADFSVSFALIQTQELGDGWRNIIHKGNADTDRTPAIWKFHSNTGLFARVSTTHAWDEGIGDDPAVALNEWVYFSFVKEGQTLTTYHNGVLAATVALIGQTVANNGPLFIGRDPWYYGVPGAGLDNIQMHSRALTE